MNVAIGPLARSTRIAFSEGHLLSAVRIKCSAPTPQSPYFVCYRHSEFNWIFYLGFMLGHLGDSKGTATAALGPSALSIESE